MMLCSGLPELIANEEPLARFLVSSGHFNSVGVKQSAFLPSPKDRETSVFRHGAEPAEQLWALAETLATGDRRLHGAAIVQALHVREALLEVMADEPPDRHAAIRGWPFNEADPELQKARQKEIATIVASRSTLFLR